ncbi:TonB-dependent receptor [Pedobacter caeni]|uniref:Iron complex outermembrane recepter protein n=1 Tax=Pedobacter caeni TaxID=288992 RepID=A0A1M4W836_9SPHI|nr:TonB-dependent receptor [Pedobacter caeni]SHE77386.1 iron complex outermembrane recepter protein [Pedobacter caeni]
MKQCYLILLLLFPAFLSAQTTDSLKKTQSFLSGRVTDLSGKPVDRATITLPDTKHKTLTDREGEFKLSGISAGTYHILIKALGYNELQEIISIKNNEENRVTFTLEVKSEKLTEVAITGQKRKTASITKSELALIDIPISIQVIDRKLIEQRQIISIEDAIKNVSGLTQNNSYNGAYSMFNGRGFDLNASANFRRNGIFTYNNSQLFTDNIESIEILKGPASIQFGDIAPGAVMNFVTKKPLDTTFQKFELKVDDYGMIRPTIDINGKLTKNNKLLYRLNTSYESGKDFVDHVNSKNYLIAPTIAWKITDQLNWNIELVARNDQRTMSPGLVSKNGDFEELKKMSVRTFLGEPNTQARYNEASVYATLSYKLNKDWHFQNTFYYSKVNSSYESIYFTDNKVLDNGDLNRKNEFWRTFEKSIGTSNDLIGKIKVLNMTHNVVLGFDNFYSDNAYYNAEYKDLKPFNIYNPRYGENELPLTPGFEGDKDKEKSFIKRYGFYLQDQIKIWKDKLQFLLGIRFNATTRGQKYTAAVPAPDGYRNDKQTPFTPRFGLLFKPYPNLSFYASYAKSYEQNGWETTSRIMLKPTLGEQLDFGVKSNFLNDRLGISLSVFKINKSDVMGYVMGLAGKPDFPHLFYNEEFKWALYDGAKHRSKGIELDINGKITGELSVNIAASYIEAKVVADPAYKTGNLLSGAPKVISNLWADYQLDKILLKGLDIGLGLSYRGQFYSNTLNLPNQKVSSYLSMDLAVGYKYKNVFTRLNVSNLTNNIGYLATDGVYRPFWPRRSIFSIGYKI